MARVLSSRSRWRLLILGLMAVVALVPFMGIIWDGGFESAEYRLRFVDESGRPVPGVALRVLTRAGGVCHLYPVNEFLPDSTPTSDADGRMAFHHVGRLEFGGHEYHNLVGMRFGDTRAPQYVLVFAVGGREVYRTWYDDLRPRGRVELPSVTVKWHSSDWPTKEYIGHPDEGTLALKLRLYDGDGNGVLDREERTAAGYFERAAVDALELDRGSLDVTFRIVERTVVISLPE